MWLKSFSGAWKNKWITIIILALALAIVVIDGTVMNVSISNIVKDLDTDLKSIQWAITLYALITAALTILGGRMGDFFGRKKMFALGAGIFAIGSLTTTFSQNVGMLIFGWSVLEGIGASLMMPATVSLITANYEGRDRGIAFGIWGGVAGASAAFGPILGGYLTTNFTWRWAFLINVFVVALLIGGSVLIKDKAQEISSKKLDFWGVILSTFGLASFVYGIVESSTYGWLVAKKDYEFVNGTSYNLGGLSVSIYTIILGILVLAGFILWEYLLEKRGGLPLVSIKIFKNRQFSVGLLITSILALGQSGIIFVLPIFFQSVREKSAFETGLALLPLSLTLLIAAPLSGLLASKIKPRILIQVGIAIAIVASFVLYYSLNVSSDIKDFALGQILYGLSMGIIMSQISNITLSAVNPSEIGQASGLNSMIRQVGASLGSALIGAAFLSNFSDTISDGIKTSSLLVSKQKDFLLDLLDKNPSGFEFGGNDFFNSFAKINKDLPSQLHDFSHQAVVDGGRAGLVFLCVFMVICLGVSFFIPSVTKH